jgi:hypothetical protein
MAMTWTTFHRRGSVLSAVIDAVDARRDGLLPMHLPGVRETFGDELALLGALQLRWHTRLSGHLERAFMRQPADAEEAVVEAWRGAAEELPGIRQVLDRHYAEPLDEQMAASLETATRKERALLAAMAGRAAGDPETAYAAGHELERRARAGRHAVPA